MEDTPSYLRSRSGFEERTWLRLIKCQGWRDGQRGAPLPQYPNPFFHFILYYFLPNGVSKKRKKKPVGVMGIMMNVAETLYLFFVSRSEYFMEGGANGPLRLYDKIQVVLTFVTSFFGSLSRQGMLSSFSIQQTGSRSHPW